MSKRGTQYQKKKKKRGRGEKVPDVSGSSSGSNSELCGQHRGQEPLHNLSEGNQGWPRPLCPLLVLVTWLCFDISPFSTPCKRKVAVEVRGSRPPR
nr:hypothetical protein CFP56_77107 [Quercus suber]